MNTLDHGTDGDQLIRSEGIVGETTATLIQVNEVEVLLKFGVNSLGYSSLARHYEFTKEQGSRIITRLPCKPPFI